MLQRSRLAIVLATLLAIHPLTLPVASAQAVTCFGAVPTITGTAGDDVLRVPGSRRHRRIGRQRHDPGPVVTT
jgi:hypothetical protein